MLLILYLNCACAFGKREPQRQDTLLLYRKLLSLGVVVGVALHYIVQSYIVHYLLHYTLPKKFSFWTKKYPFLDSLTLSILNPLHHPNISIYCLFSLVHHPCGTSTFNSTHARCCFSTLKTPGFRLYLERKKFNP